MRDGLMVGAAISTAALVMASAPASAGGLAAGDFNGDGFADLAVGVAHDDLDGVFDCGVVNVIYGSAGKLTSTDNQSWHQNRPGINDNAAANERFGAHLAAGDFNTDGFDDLVIAVPNEVFNGVVRGAVHIVYGTAAGLDDANTQFFDQVAVGSTANEKNKFAHAVGVGDFNGDTFDDLVISEPEKKVTAQLAAGQINVVYGSMTGLDTATAEQWDMTSLGSDPRSEDRFGLTLDRGDFDDDGFEDLAVGIPGRRTHAAMEIGAVAVIYGTAGGLDPADLQFWEPATPGMNSVQNPHERFGAALAGGDFNADGWDDLAIGAPGKEVNSVTKAGSVHVLYGTADGLDISGNQYFHQNASQIDDDAELKEQFGSALASGDFNGDSRIDLAIGVPRESLTLANLDTADAGQVHVLLGSITGLTTNGSQLWSMKANGMKGEKGAGRFGSGLVSADFDDDGHDDLAVAAPWELVGTKPKAGAVHVLYATMNGLEVADNQNWHQDRPGIENTCNVEDRFGE